jgi:DHA2 family multidrug resistance protein
MVLIDKKPLIGLVGVIVATMSAELNGLVFGIALPDIRGDNGLDSVAGAWLTSLYTTGEIIGMAVATWWAITLSLRRFTLLVIALACATSLAMALAGDVGLLLPLRFVQGLASGLTIPLLMTTALRVLPPPIRLYGLAAYASTATFFPYLSATIAAFWTEGAGWKFILYETAPLAAVSAVLVWYGLPQDVPQHQRIRTFDLRGALLLIMGCGALSTLLMQGERLDWFHSKLIAVLALVSVVAIPLFLLNEWFKDVPFLKLQLLGRRNFAYGAICLFLFLIIGLSASETPLAFLQDTQGYRPLQANIITLQIAALQLFMLPAMALVLNVAWVDARWVSLVGLSLILAACLGDSQLSAVWSRDQFYLWQALQAVGQPMVVVPLLMISTNAVEPSEGPFAAAMINVPRALAEAVGAGLLTLIGRFRGNHHMSRLADRLGEAGVNAVGSAHRTPADLAASVGQQARVLTFGDAFLILAVLAVVLIAIVLVLPVHSPPPRLALAKSPGAP